MKKIIIAVLLSNTLSLVLFKSELSAQQTKKVENLIKVNNLLIYEKDLGYGYLYRRTLSLLEPINLTVGKTYTLVLGKDFYNEQDWEDMGYTFEPIKLKMYNSNPNENSIISLNPVRHQETIYVTFEAIHSKLDFYDLEVGKSNDIYGVTDIILYEGEISDFRSFVSYYSNLEPIKGAYIMNYDNLLTFDDLLELFEFSDNIDNLGKLTVDIIYNDFDPSKKDPGIYEVLFSVSDTRHNKQFYELTIHVLDITPPVISGPDYYEVEAKDHDLNIGKIIQNLSFYDNHTKLHPQDLVLIQDNFSYNKDRPGDYIVEIMIADSSNNETTYPINIKVTDSKPPVVSGPYEIYRYLNDPVLTLSDYKALFSSVDEIDGDVTAAITVSGEYNPNQVGTTILRIVSVDSSGNETRKPFRVHVIDGVPPIMTTDELIISFETYSQMDRQDMVDWLYQNMPNAQNIEILYDETLYLKNAKTKTYIYYSYELDGQKYYSRLAIEPSKFNITKLYIAAIGFISISLTFTAIYINRFKRLTTYFK